MITLVEVTAVEHSVLLILAYDLFILLMCIIYVKDNKTVGNLGYANVWIMVN